MESAVDVVVDSKHAAIPGAPTIRRSASGDELNAIIFPLTPPGAKRNFEIAPLPYQLTHSAALPLLLARLAPAERGFMRSFVLILVCAGLAPSVLSSQQPAPHPVLVDDVPEGTNWIANASTHLYYPVGCPITASIPAADKLFYKSETSLQTAGFTKSTDCDNSAADNPAPTAAPAPVTTPSATAAATPAAAQAGEKPAKQKNRRSGFWFNGGFGYGSLGCKDCGTREGSLSGGIALGGSVSQKVLLGVATTGWAKSFDGGAELDVGTLVAVIRFYPSATGAFFLLGGLGVGSIHAKSPDLGTQTETGFGAVLGLGYDIRVGSNVSLTPFWNGFAVNTDNDDANVGQIGLGLTIH